MVQFTSMAISHPLVLNSAQIPHQLILSSSPVHSAPKRLSSDARSDFNSTPTHISSAPRSPAPLLLPSARAREILLLRTHQDHSRRGNWNLTLQIPSECPAYMANVIGKEHIHVIATAGRRRTPSGARV